MSAAWCACSTHAWSTTACPPTKRGRLVSEVEVYARDLATRAHVAAKDSQGRTKP
jgi:hypothetical protein